MFGRLLFGYIIISFLIGFAQTFNRNRVLCRLFVVLFCSVQIFFASYVVTHVGEKIDVFFVADGMAALLTMVLTVISAACFSHSRRYIIENEKEQEPKVRAQYYAAMTVLTMALTMAGLSAHLAMTWIFIEITTLCASALIFYRRNSGSIEATWKYVFACSISLVLVYVGILFTAVAMGADGEAGLDFDTLSSHASLLDSFWLKMAFIFILVGYTAKMGLVPMFTAGIDAKDKAPTPAAAMLSSVVMNAGFVGFYRFYAITCHTEIARWARMVVLLTGLISVFVAAVYLIRVYNVKRLFAYSSVEHIGVVMIGLAAGGVGIYAAILHLILHSFAKSAVFLHIGQLYRVYAAKELTRMGEYMKRSGMGGSIVIIGLLCITAMPPSGLFITELSIFQALIDAGWWASLAICLVLLCVIVWAVARDGFSLLFVASTEPEVSRINGLKMPWSEALWQIILLAISIWWGMRTPEFVASLVREAAALV